MFIKENLLFLRKKSNLTQLEISKQLEISEVGYQALERKASASIPSVATLTKLKQIYNVSIDDLLFKDLSKEI
ncbi:MAG: helix-turn-helix domain-containing protein [Erysipelotrichales bacterium]|nr:helix-turn-helix domain-containing protein [Erysipelotrichales bacterium]